MSDAAGYRCIALGSQPVSLEWADDQSRRWLEILLGAHPSVAPVLPGLCLRVHADAGERVTVFADQACLYRGTQPGVAMHALVDRLVAHWCSCCNEAPLLHAGLVSRQGRGLLFPGASGAGKSTLVARLHAGGWQYHSDELVHAGTGEGGWQGLGRAICLKSGWQGALPETIVASALDGDALSWVPAARSSFDGVALAQKAEPAAIVFPRYRPGERPQLRTLSAARALSGLMQSLLNAPALVGRALPLLSAIVSRVPAYACDYGVDKLMPELMDSLSQLIDESTC